MVSPESKPKTTRPSLRFCCRRLAAPHGDSGNHGTWPRRGPECIEGTFSHLQRGFGTYVPRLLWSRPDGGFGRRARLKLLCPHGAVSWTPTLGTNDIGPPVPRGFA